MLGSAWTLRCRPATPCQSYCAASFPFFLLILFLALWYQPCHKVFDILFITVTISGCRLHSFRPSGRRGLIWGTIPTFALKDQVKSRTSSVTFVIRTRNRPTFDLTLILRRSRTETVWFYTSTNNKRAARPKLYTKSLTRDLKRMYSRLTLVRISINL